MASQSVLSDIRDHEGRCSVVAFHLLDRFAQVFLPQRIDIEGIVSFEHRMQRLLQADRCFVGIGNTIEHVGQFNSRSDSYFIPIEVTLLKSGKRFVGGVEHRVFEDAGV